MALYRNTGLETGRYGKQWGSKESTGVKSSEPAGEWFWLKTISRQPRISQLANSRRCQLDFFQAMPKVGLPLSTDPLKPETAEARERMGCCNSRMPPATQINRTIQQAGPKVPLLFRSEFHGIGRRTCRKHNHDRNSPSQIAQSCRL